MPLTFEPNIAAPESANFFATPDLSQEAADRAAMGWQDRVLSIDNGTAGEVDPQERVQLIEGLTNYRSFKQNTGHKVFSHRQAVNSQRRAQDVMKNLPVWSQLFSDDGFENALERRGLLSKFKRMEKMTGDSELSKNIYRRKVFLHDYAGRADEMAQTHVAKNLFGMTDFSDESFVPAAKEWVKKRDTERIFMERAVDSGFRTVLTSLDPEEVHREFEGFRDLDPRMGELFKRSAMKAEAEFAPVLDTVKSITSALTNEGAPHEQITNGVLEIYKNGHRDKFLEALSYMAGERGEDVDGFFWKLRASWREGLKSFGGDFINFFDRDENSALEKSMKENGGRVILINSGLKKGDLARGAEARDVEDSPSRFRYATDKEMKTIRKNLGDSKAMIQAISDFKNIRPQFERVKSGHSGVLGDFEQGILDATNSIPTMLSAMVPGGVVGTFGVYAEGNTQELIAAGYTEEDAKAYGSAAAVPMSAIEFLQGKTVVNLVPGGKSLIQRMVGGEGLKRVVAGAAAGVAAEYTQETIQEAMLPLTTEFIEEINESVPELNQWDNYQIMDKRRFWAVLPLGFLGGLGGKGKDSQIPDVEKREILTDISALRLDGATVQEANEIASLAKSDPQAALDQYREIHESKTAEERDAIAIEALDQLSPVEESEFSREEQDEVQRELEEAIGEIGGPDFLASGGSSLTKDSDFDLDSPESELSPIPIEEAETALEDIKGSVESAIGFDLSGQKWTVRPADTGGKDNDTRGTTGLARAVAGVFGRQLVVFDADSPPPFRGLFNTNHPDKVFVWGDADKPHLTLTGHELAHAIQTQAPDLWSDLLSRLDKEFVRLDQLEKEKIGYRKGDLKAEAIGDFLGDNLANKEFWDGLAVRQPKVFGKLAGVVMSFLDSVIAKLKKAGFQSDRWFRDVTVARGILADTVAEFGAKVNNEGGSTIRSQGEGPNLFSLTRDSQLQFALSKQLGRSGKRIEILTNMRGQIGRMLTEAPNQRRLEELRAQEASLKKEIQDLESQEITPGEREEALRSELSEELERVELDLSVLDQAFEFEADSIEGDLSQTIGDIAENVVAEYAARIEDGNLSKTQKAKLTNEAQVRLTERKNSAKKLASKDREIARNQISTERKELRSEAALLRARIGGKIALEQGKTRASQQAKIRSLKARLSQVQGSMKARSLRADMAIMSSMVGLLPANMRGKISGVGKMAQLTSEAARAKQLAKIANQFGDVIETELRSEYTKKIRKIMDQSTAKADKMTRRRKSKIGPSAHVIAEAATDAMAKSPEKAQGIAEGIRNDFEAKENPTLQDMEEAEGSALAYELFADFQNADSSRMERMVEFLNLNYSEGRKEWLSELEARKNRKDSRVELLRKSIGSTDFTDFPEISRSNAKKSSVKGFFQELASFYQMTDFLAERSSDPEARAVVEEMQTAFRQARNEYADSLDAEQDAITESVGSILGVSSGVNQFARLNGKLVKLSKPKEVKATFLAGRVTEEISVSKNVVEAVIRQEVGGVDGQQYSKADRESLEVAWERFLALPEEVQNRKQNVTFERVKSKGVRKTLGMLSQLDLAKEWLALQQADAREKYAKGGWDERTAEEIQAELDPEVLEVARWMQSYLRENTPETDAIHRQEYGLALASVENYFPLLFNVVNNDSQISMDGNNVAVSARKGSFLKSRVSHAAMPKQANALAVLQSHVASVEFWKSHAPVIREWGGVLRDQKFQDAMQAKMGPDFTRNLNNWLKLIDANGRDQTMITLEADKMIRGFQGGMALSVLGGRLRTVLVNMTAALNVTFHVPLGKLFKGLRPEVFGDVVTLAKSPTFQRRLKSGGSYEATVALEQRLGGGMTATTLRRAGQIAMQPINFADTLTNLTTALAYRAQVVENRKSGMSEKAATEQALDYVDEIITRVAQPTDALSRSLFENKRRGGIGGLLFLFASEARKNTALMGLAARKVLTGKGAQSRGMAIQQILMGTLAYTSLGYILKAAVQSFTKDDEGEDPGERFMSKMTDTRAITHTMSTEHLRGIPFLGEFWSAGVATALNEVEMDGEKIMVWDSSANPLMRPLKGAKAATKIPDAENWDEVADAVIDTIQGVGGFIPETAIFSQVANVAEDSLGFMRATLGQQLSADESENVIVSKLRQRKEEILVEDREEMKEAKGSARKKIESKRNEAYLEELIKWRSESGPEYWPGVLKKITESKMFPVEIIESLKDQRIR